MRWSCLPLLILLAGCAAPTSPTDSSSAGTQGTTAVAAAIPAETTTGIWSLDSCPAAPWPEGLRWTELVLARSGWTPELQRWSVGGDGIRVEERLPDAVVPFPFTGEMEWRLTDPKPSRPGAAADTGIVQRELPGGHTILLSHMGVLSGLSGDSDNILRQQQDGPGALVLRRDLTVHSYLPGFTAAAVQNDHTLLLRSPSRTNATLRALEPAGPWWLEVRDASFTLVANLTLPASAGDRLSFSSGPRGPIVVTSEGLRQVQKTEAGWEMAAAASEPYPSVEEYANYAPYFTSPGSGPSPQGDRQSYGSYPDFFETYVHFDSPEQGMYVNQVFAGDDSLVWLGSLESGHGLARIDSIAPERIEACWMHGGKAPQTWFVRDEGFAWMTETEIGLYDRESGAVLVHATPEPGMLIRVDGAAERMAT